MKRKSLLRRNEYLIILIFTAVSVLVGIFGLNQIKKDSIKTVKTTLTTINNSCNEALMQWMNFRRNNIHELSKNKYLISKTVALLKLRQDSAVLVSSPLTSELRKFFQPILAANEDLGVFLIAPDYISIFSMRNVNTGKYNLMAKQSKGLLDKVLHDGRIILIPPIQSDVVLHSKYSNESHETMFLVAPVIYRNKIIAAFSLRLDIQKDFSRILELGRINKTGETFGVDKSGNLVTASRFESELIKTGRLKLNQQSITNVNATGFRQNKGNPDSAVYLSHNLVELKDYRGEQVYCVSNWNKALNIGIITKIDKKEALKEFFYVRKVLFITFVSLLVIVLVIINIIVNLRQKTEDILEDSNKMLEVKVAQRTEELQKTIRIKDKFFSIIAHDLRSPFNGLLGLFDLLRHNPEAIPEDERNKMIHQIYSSSVQLFRLLENLLNWSRSQTNDIKLNPENIFVNELVSENFLLQKEQAKSKKIELINESMRDARVFADRNTIDTVLRNLISNAIKFTQEGGEIKVKTLFKDNNSVEILVQDNGVGMPEETLHKLFNVDEKISTKGTNNEKGSGLGLALCKEFVELNQGKISVESKVGKGSTFIVTLPGFQGK